MSEAQVATVIENLRRAAILVTPQIQVNPQVADKDDIKLFACAVAGEAGYIISGDRWVQEVGTYQGIHVIAPSLFLTALEQRL